MARKAETNEEATMVEEVKEKEIVPYSDEDRVEKELGQKVTVVGTGGLMGVVQPAMRHEVHRDKGLLLTGLRVIYERSRAHRGPEKGQKGEEE